MKIISHRGNDSNLNENREEGLLLALDKNYIDGIEFDIQITKDGFFILSHSNYIKTEHKVYSIEKTNLKDLQKQKFIKNGKKYPITELSSFLKKIYSNKIILLEMKVNHNEKKYYKKLIKIIKKYSYLNLWLCSFNDKILSYFPKKYQIGLIKTRIINHDKEENYDFLSSNYEIKKDIPYFLWTINRIEKIPQKENFIGIITDKPSIFKNKVI